MSKAVAVVTGGASGIGLALVKHLLTKDYKVVIADVNEAAGAALSKELGSDTLFHHTDVSVYDDQVALFKRAFAWGGDRLDFFAANAGIDDRQDLYQKADAFDERGEIVALNMKTIQVDLDAIFQGMWIFKHYARKNRKPGGKIVITSSMGGLYSSPVNAQYCVAKAAVIQLARCSGPAFMEKENITVNAICPAFVVTSLCPPEVLKVFPKEHITPMSTVIKAFDTFLESNVTGKVVEATLDELHYRDQVGFPNASEKWMMEESMKVWALAYA